MSGHFRIISSPDGLHVFSLVTDDDRQLVQSVLHRSREQLAEAIELVRRAARHAETTQHWRSLDGQHYFQLRDARGQLLASSSLYGSLEALKADLEEVARLAAEADTVEVRSRWTAAAPTLSRRQGDTTEGTDGEQA
jgi:uncharacterized protein YegP (UPF0339 family)